MLIVGLPLRTHDTLLSLRTHDCYIRLIRYPISVRSGEFTTTTTIRSRLDGGIMHYLRMWRTGLHNRGTLINILLGFLGP